jgi:hypothetical protein
MDEKKVVYEKEMAEFHQKVALEIAFKKTQLSLASLNIK